MTAATLDIAPPARVATAPAGGVLIATVNRAAGDTGVHTHTRTLAAGLRAAGRDVRVVTPFDAGRQWLPIFAVRPLVLRRLNPTWGTRWYRHWHMAALRASLRPAMADAAVRSVLAQCPLSARAALDVRAELGAERRISVTAVCHFNRSEADEYRDKGELADDAAYRRMLDFEAAALGDADHVVYVSGWARDLVERERGIRTRDGSVIWNALGEARKSVAGPTRGDLGLRDADVVLLNVGSIEPRKDQAGLVELFGRIAGRHADARLVLVGDGADRPRVEAAVARLGLGDKVRLLGHRTDVSDLMRLADVYVHHAKAENCPVVLIEAARAGLPIAATPVGGVPEILAAVGDEAVTLDASDAEASAARLAPLLASPERRAAAGRRSAEAFREHFGLDAMVRRYLDVIDARAAR